LTIDLRSIRYFIAVCDAGSLAAAARALGRNDKTVLGQLQRLEDDLTLKLFHALGTGPLTLTMAGQSYYEDCQRILGELNRARQAAAAMAEGRSGVIRLGLCEDAATAWLSSALRRFRHAYPDLSFEMHEMGSAELAAALRRHELDLALLIPAVDTSGLDLVPLWQDEWVVIVPPDWRALPRRELTCQDIAQDALVLSHPSLGVTGHDCIRSAFAEAGILPNIAALGLGRSTMLSLGLINVGLTFVPASLAWGGDDRERTIPFRAPRLELAAAYRAADPPGSAMRFLRVLQEAAHERFA
jgi:DNA-binding transcriptional LysR family regulator